MNSADLTQPGTNQQSMRSHPVADIYTFDSSDEEIEDGKSVLDEERKPAACLQRQSDSSEVEGVQDVDRQSKQLEWDIFGSDEGDSEPEQSHQADGSQLEKQEKTERTDSGVFDLAQINQKIFRQKSVNVEEKQDSKEKDQNDLKKSILKIQNTTNQKGSRTRIETQFFQSDSQKENCASLHEQSSHSGIKIEGAALKSQKVAQYQYLEEKKALKVTNMKTFLFTQLSPEYKITAIIKRVSSGSLFSSGPKYSVIIEENNKFLFSVLKTGKGEFLFSFSKENIANNNKNYLGLLEANFSNSEFLFYDFGLNPKNTKVLEFSRKQVAYIRYEDTAGPKKFETLISTNSRGFQSLEGDSNVLKNKWEKKDRKNLCRLFSKAPEYDSTDGNFKLDFKGMVGKASIKNFILGNDTYQDCLIFARRSEDSFALQVKTPFSVIEAVAVCISSIHQKDIL